MELVISMYGLQISSLEISPEYSVSAIAREVLHQLRIEKVAGPPVE